MPGCFMCARGLCDECHLPTDSCCLADLAYVDVAKPIGRKLLPDDEIKDPRSTMRKRAQRILSEVRNVHIDDPCEWRGKADVGGGRHPIVGCRDGVVKHIHHGPDKNWFNNSPDNLSGICHTCHNRWHARNDKCYEPTISNSPRVATEEEMKLWNDHDGMPKIHHDLCPPSSDSSNMAESESEAMS